MKEQLNNLRHSAAHLLAAAVMELYPDAKRTIGPAIENGFYYDFDFGSVTLTEEDLPKIEEKMGKLLKDWKGFARREVSADEAKEFYKDNPYKIELIEQFASEGQTLTFYDSMNYKGEAFYTDLCRGGHAEQPKKEIGAFKLLSLAGAYWRGDEKNKMLTRIYGTAFSTKEELDAHLEMLEDAKRRDHRKLGRELELFIFDDLVGPGLPLWLPNGTILKDELEKFAIETEYKWGYKRVSTPHLAKQQLFETSGHLPYYTDSMFPPMKLDDGNYYLKAMNCPMTHLIYRSKPRSYKDLPLRYAEYGMVYRYELSGALAGLLRVRGMEMNDAHIYCSKEDIKAEFLKVIDLHKYYYSVLGIKDYWMRLSLHDADHKEKYVDNPELWEFSENAIREAMQESGLPFVEAKDEAAFYGPKIDFQFKSVSGREETASTDQLDFLASERFNLKFIDNEGQEQPVYVIHRAPLGTHERFLAFLIEHFAGAFPAWLAPVQVKVVPISDKHNEYAREVGEKLLESDVRFEVDERSETMQSKIRDAQLQKIPYMIVVGDKEVDAKLISVRSRNGENKNGIKLEEFLEELMGEIQEKK